MFWVHHVEQAYVIFIFFNERSPFCFVGYFAIKQFGFEHVAELHSVCSLFHSSLFLLLFLVAFLCLQDVLGKCIDSVQFI